MTQPENVLPEHEEMWRTVLVDGHRSRAAFVPGSPKCTLCSIPMGGVATPVLKLMNRGPSRKNPVLCNL